jgi:hypothetical protein
MRNKIVLLLIVVLLQGCGYAAYSVVQNERLKSMPDWLLRGEAQYHSQEFQNIVKFWQSISKGDSESDIKNYAAQYGAKEVQYAYVPFALYQNREWLPDIKFISQSIKSSFDPIDFRQGREYHAIFHIDKNRFNKDRKVARKIYRLTWHGCWRTDENYLISNNPKGIEIHYGKNGYLADINQENTAYVFVTFVHDKMISKEILFLPLAYNGEESSFLQTGFNLAKGLVQLTIADLTSCGPESDFVSTPYYIAPVRLLTAHADMSQDQVKNIFYTPYLYGDNVWEYRFPRPCSRCKGYVHVLFKFNNNKLNSVEIKEDYSTHHYAHLVKKYIADHYPELFDKIKEEHSSTIIYLK